MEDLTTTVGRQHTAIAIGKDLTEQVKRGVDVLERFAGLFERVIVLVEKAAAEEAAARGAQ